MPVAAIVIVWAVAPTIKVCHSRCGEHSRGVVVGGNDGMGPWPSRCTSIRPVHLGMIRRG